MSIIMNKIEYDEIKLIKVILLTGNKWKINNQLLLRMPLINFLIDVMQRSHTDSAIYQNKS